ncbi:restriction endonuclease [Mycobacterium paraense]|uniref:restriction endonuclease n=1 Tax=Mycobacterium paraense TaxID=767916 RepID=UPI000A14CA71|nr:restriction endonuclease [Mycobacterium paraense]MCV7442031.1 restriction endonuclease [Mycobacterium paraense]ORW41039.1 hypothetical protein AWB89_21175 [Mycobacterium paraense]
MPKRTNEFQELVTALTQILGRDVATPSAMLPDSAVPGERREVDICAEGQVSGHKVVLGIECRAWKRPQTVEWVEAMYGKHSHLPTDKLVLVSASGFTPAALKLAEFLRIKAITPDDVTPGFVGEVVNNLDSVWVKRLDFTPDTMTAVIDPPITYPDGQVADRVDLFPILGTYLHRADSAVVCSAGDVLQQTMRNLDMNQPAVRDATGDETAFTIGSDDDPLVNGEAVYLMGGDDPDPPRTLRRITKVLITGKLKAHVVEVPLKHGQYEGTPFSTGTSKTGDETFHWVITEGDEGPRMGVRVLNAGRPTDGEFVQGKMGDWAARRAAAAPSPLGDVPPSTDDES